MPFAEFFQTVEVVVGDVYDVEVTRTWEFNSTAPIRSMVLPMVIMGSPLYILKVRPRFISFCVITYQRNLNDTVDYNGFMYPEGIKVSTMSLKIFSNVEIVTTIEMLICHVM